MKLTILLAFAALLISGTAAYFSIVGLAAIFAARFIPTVIMGAAVEIGKLITVAWLHYDWSNISNRLKYALCVPVIGVMMLTSVGVFGFLSQAHVAQTAAAEESVAQVERIEGEVARLQTVIDRAEVKIKDLESGTFKQDTATQEQIDKEQQRIDSAYDRIQPAIDEQNAIIASQTKLFEDQIAAIDEELALLKRYIEEGEVKKAQQLINEPSPGGWGPKTTETARKWRLERTDKKTELLAKIEEATKNNPEIIAARKEIQRLRANAEQQIADSTALINRLRDKIANSKQADNTDELLDAQYARITRANTDIEALTDEKYELEKEFRQLEAEVGPIKYIAEFVYQTDADADLLEQAVKWLIILLVVCLDPFAVLLVMAATDRYRLHKAEVKLRQDPDGTLTIRIEELEDELANEKRISERSANADDKRVKAELALERVQDEKAVTEEELNKAKENLAIALKDAEGNDERMLEIINERDQLQQEFNDLAKDMDIVQAEVEKVPLLEAQLRELGEISKDEHGQINIVTPGTDASLQQKVKVLTRKIESMEQLSDFDLAKAQELVEVKDAKLDAERRYQELLKKYQDLLRRRNRGINDS